MLMLMWSLSQPCGVVCLHFWGLLHIYRVWHDDWPHLSLWHPLLSPLLGDLALIVFCPSPWMLLRFYHCSFSLTHPLNVSVSKGAVSCSLLLHFIHWCWRFTLLMADRLKNWEWRALPSWGRGGEALENFKGMVRAVGRRLWGNSLFWVPLTYICWWLYSQPTSLLNSGSPVQFSTRTLWLAVSSEPHADVPDETSLCLFPPPRSGKCCILFSSPSWHSLAFPGRTINLHTL